jgi:hypothetical protein
LAAAKCSRSFEAGLIVRFKVMSVLSLACLFEASNYVLLPISGILPEEQTGVTAKSKIKDTKKRRPEGRLIKIYNC